MKRYKVTHIMNKKQLILILVAGLFCGTANAVVDLNEETAANVGTVMLASENEIDSDGTAVSGAAYNVTGTTGFIIPLGETYYALIELGGDAEFGANVVDSFTTVTASRASGGMGDSDVILSIAGPQTDDAAWTMTNMIYNLTTRGTVSFTYRLYETASNAIAGGDNALSTQSANLVTFADATSMAGTGSASSLIDVGEKSILFENGTDTSHIMKINILNVAGNQYKIGAAEGVGLVLDEIVDEITLTATGDFTAVAAITGADDKVVAAAGKVWLDADASCTPSHAEVIAAPDATPAVEGVDARNDNLGLAKINTAGLEAVVTLTHGEEEDGGAIVFEAIVDAFLCMETNGASEIPEGTYMGELSMTVEDDFEAIDDVEFTGSTLAKNSDSTDLDFLLTPDGIFRNYVRLTNTSHVPGDNLRVTLINDAGDSVSFDLSDVVDEAGDSVSDELAAGASTPLININALYAAAVAVDRGDDADDEPIATFTAIDSDGDGKPDGKLRAQFEGSFLVGKLIAQALSVSTDNTSFFTF